METGKDHEAVGVLKDLIRIQSVNPHFEVGAAGENGVADYIERRLQGSGLKVTRQPVFPGRDNVLIELRTGHPDATLLFEAHMDTVGLGSMVDPLTPVVREGRLYGRGACDTKGSLAGMLYAMEQCARHPERLSADLVLLAACDEEHEYKGLMAFIAERMPVAGAVVGEPTELNVVVAHKGVVRLAVRTYGKAAHSSVPHEGDSAVYQMMHVLQFIRDVIEPELDAVHHPLCGGPTIVVGKITGGTQVNIVPESCEIEIDRRIIPGESSEQVLADFKSRLAAYLEGKGATCTVHELLLTWSLDTPPDEAIVLAALEAARRCGVSAEPVGVPYGSDASKLQHIAGIPSIVFGPGSIAQAHAKEEWVEIDQMAAAAQFYYRLATEFGTDCRRT